eukprot:10727769-Heterocapsa_arctica.AAC.1
MEFGRSLSEHTNEEGNPGRSGGFAILVWTGRLILKNTFEADHRIIGATLGWGRTTSIHIFYIYGFDLGQKDKHGQSYYQRGNPSLRDRLGTCIIEGTNSSAAYIDPGAATCHTGNSLDWFIVSGGLALTA